MRAPARVAVAAGDVPAAADHAVRVWGPQSGNSLKRWGGMARACRWEPSALITTILLPRPPFVARSKATFLPFGEKTGVKPAVPRPWRWVPPARMALIRPNPRASQATIRL